MRQSTCLSAWPYKQRGWWLLIPCCWLGREMSQACLLLRPLCRGCCDLITRTCRWMGGFPRQPQCIQKIHSQTLSCHHSVDVKQHLQNCLPFPPIFFFFHLSHCFLQIWAKCTHGAICYSCTDNATDVLIYTTWLLLCSEPIQSKLSNPFNTK